MARLWHWRSLPTGIGSPSSARAARPTPKTGVSSCGTPSTRPRRNFCRSNARAARFTFRPLARFWELDAAGPIDLITDLKSDKSGNFAFSPDASLMAGGCLDNTVRIWDVATLKEQYRLTNSCYVVAFTSGGKKLLATAADGIAC